MKRRPRRSVPAVLVALVVLAGCVLAAIVAVQTIIGEKPWLSYDAVASALHDTRWSDPLPPIAGGVVALLGLLLLVAAIVPGRPTVLPLEGGTDSGASRRSYRSTLRTAASTVDGVSAAKLKVKRSKIVSVVTTGRTNTAGLADAVRAAIEHRLSQIGPATVPAVRVRVKATRSAS
ncbi:hypothetical protein SAMN04489729_7845 [Amycolatopsis lurida]|uniref:DUF6286 domain-containing protein n=1 Tax=Amycolatopsis lurida NRRL 2430 TaxID=1460371 RepID=A0A2P2FIS1_AMYLU|nr:DUF6286 domain-containing protein [Amycolatopsis lurida]KFU76627.1 hypothetical protein BB31_34875 [Amycolatopsis lurida NRRL 2430]SEE51386.1 hypothetical protein SAMN04489729_7845 [Amycolatopsis lurida]